MNQKISFTFCVFFLLFNVSVCYSASFFSANDSISNIPVTKVSNLINEGPTFYLSTSTYQDSLNYLQYPPVRLVDSFEGIAGTISTWWDGDGNKIYQREFVNDISYSGNNSMEVYFKKTDPNFSWSFFAFQPKQDNIGNNFSGYDKLIFWLYVPETYRGNPLTLLIKFQDKNGGFLEETFEFQASKEWQLVEFNFTQTDALDLTKIDNVLFFADPGSQRSGGKFWIDDMYLLNDEYIPSGTPNIPIVEEITESLVFNELIWSDESSSGAILYEVQFSRDSDFTNAVSFWTNNTYLEIEEMDPNTYYYRVRSWSHLPEYDGRVSEWSGVIKYQIANLAPKIGEVGSFSASDTDDIYPAGSMIRVFATEETNEGDIVKANVRIRSPVTGYDSGDLDLILSEDSSYWFVHWNTFGLSPSDGYQAIFTFKDTEGYVTANQDLVMSLTKSVPIIISRLLQVQDSNFIGEGAFLPFIRTYDYQLEIANELGLGKGWIHTYGSYLKEYADSSVEIVWSDSGVNLYTKEPDGSYKNIGLGNYPKLIRQDDCFIAYRQDGSRYKFNLEGELKNIIKPNGAELTLYHHQGHLYKVFDKTTDKYIEFEYENDLLKQVVTSSGNAINYKYNSNNMLSEVEDVFGRVIRYEYRNSRLSKITEPNGKITYYEYYQDGRIKSLYNNNGNNKTTYSYNPEDSSIAVTDSYGYTTKYIYNSYGQAIQRTDPLGSNTYYTYDDFGNLSQLTDQNDNITSFEYDDAGNPTRIIDAQGNILRVAYNSSLSHPVLITDPRGNTTRFTYDEAGNITSITDAKGSTTTFSYDENGLLSAKDGPASLPTEFNYTKEGLLNEIIDSQGNISRFNYDNFTRLISFIDANSNQTQFEYEEGNLTSKTDALGEEVEYRYDEFGNLVTLIDPKGQSVNYKYDEVGRLIQIIYPDNTSLEYEYDLEGNLISRTDRKSNTIHYKYDPLRRLIEKTYPDDEKVNYAYDAVGNITKIESGQDVLEYSYSCLNQETSAIDTFGNEIFYEYDPSGNLKQLTYPDGSSLIYEYDNNNQLTQIVDSSNGDVFSFSYDKAGRLEKLARPNGVITNYNYNEHNQLINITHINQEGVIIEEFNYTYDAIGNRVSTTSLDNEYKYEYDDIYQLIGFKTEDSNINYTYDAVSNRKSITIAEEIINYTSNQLNQYTEVKSTQYEYDENGNIISKITHQGMSVYEYDYDNRLTKVVLPNEDIIRYKYDSLGRRIQRIHNDDITNYIYNNWQVIAETDIEGNIKAKYIYGQGLDEVLSMTRDDDTYYYLQDILGNVIALTDREGNIVEEYEYLPFGNVYIKDAGGRSIEKSSIDNPYFFTGRRLDQDTGLYYFRYRDYDSDIGRFIQAEPELTLTLTNLYTYVDNNPINFIDPVGLSGGYAPTRGPGDVPKDPQSSSVSPTIIIQPATVDGIPWEMIYGPVYDWYEENMRNWVKEKIENFKDWIKSKIDGK